MANGIKKTMISIKGQEDKVPVFKIPAGISGATADVKAALEKIQNKIEDNEDYGTQVRDKMENYFNTGETDDTEVEDYIATTTIRDFEEKNYYGEVQPQAEGMTNLFDNQY